MADSPDTRTTSRRLFVASGSVAAVFAALHTATAASSPDAEIVALSEEVVRLAETAQHIQDECVNVYEEDFQAIFRNERDSNIGFAKACAYSREVGREAAIEEIEAVDKRADVLFDKMMAIPAGSAVGRAAKVKALMVHVLGEGWCGPASELDWDREKARALLGEFAGLSETELSAIGGAR